MDNTFVQQVVSYLNDNAGRPTTSQDIFDYLKAAGYPITSGEDLQTDLREMQQKGLLYPHEGYWYPTYHSTVWGASDASARGWYPERHYNKVYKSYEKQVKPDRNDRMSYIEEWKKELSKYYDHFKKNHPEYGELFKWLDSSKANFNEFIMDAMAIFLRMDMTHPAIKYENEVEDYIIPENMVAVEHAMNEVAHRLSNGIPEYDKKIVDTGKYRKAYDKISGISEEITSKFILEIIGPAKPGTVISEDAVKKYIDKTITKALPAGVPKDLFYSTLSNKLAYLSGNKENGIFLYNTPPGDIIFNMKNIIAMSEDAVTIWNTFYSTGATALNKVNNIASTIWSNIDLSNHDFGEKGGKGLDLKDMTIENSYFDGCNFEGCSVSGSTIKNCTFRNASFKNAVFKPASFTGNQITKMDLEGAVVKRQIKWESNTGNPVNIVTRDMSYDKKEVKNIINSPRVYTNAFPLSEEDEEDALNLAYALKAYMDNFQVLGTKKLQFVKTSVLEGDVVIGLQKWLEDPSAVPSFVDSLDNPMQWFIEQNKKGELVDSGFNKKDISKLFGYLSNITKKPKKSPKEKAKEKQLQIAEEFVKAYGGKDNVPKEALLGVLRNKESILYDWVSGMPDKVYFKDIIHIYASLIEGLKRMHVTRGFEGVARKFQALPHSTYTFDVNKTGTSHGVHGGNTQFGVAMTPTYSLMPPAVADDISRALAHGSTHVHNAMAFARIVPVIHTEIRNNVRKPLTKKIWQISEMQADPYQKIGKGEGGRGEGDERKSVHKNKYKNEKTLDIAMTNIRRYMRHWSENLLNSIIELAQHHDVDEIWMPRAEDKVSGEYKKEAWFKYYDRPAKSFGGKLQNVGVETQLDPPDDSDKSSMFYVIKLKQEGKTSSLKFSWEVQPEEAPKRHIKRRPHIMKVIYQLVYKMVYGGDYGGEVTRDKLDLLLGFHLSDVQWAKAVDYEEELLENMEEEDIFGSLKFFSKETTDESTGVQKRDTKKQVNKGNDDEFFNLLDEKGIDHEFISIPISDIKAQQKEVVDKKVKDIRESIAKGDELSACYVDKSNNMVDGHHRMIAMEEERGQSSLLPCVRIDATYKKIWDLMEESNGKESSLKFSWQRQPELLYKAVLQVEAGPREGEEDVKNKVNSIINKYDLKILAEPQIEDTDEVDIYSVWIGPGSKELLIKVMKHDEFYGGFYDDELEDWIEPIEKNKISSLKFSWHVPTEPREIAKFLFAPDGWEIRYFVNKATRSIIFYPKHDFDANQDYIAVNPREKRKLEASVVNQLDALGVTDYTMKVDERYPDAIRVYMPLIRQPIKTPWKDIIEELKSKGYDRYLGSSDSTQRGYSVVVFINKDSRSPELQQIVDIIRNMSGVNPRVTKLIRGRGVRINVSLPEVKESTLKFSWQQQIVTNEIAFEELSNFVDQHDLMMDANNITKEWAGLYGDWNREESPSFAQIEFAFSFVELFTQFKGERWTVRYVVQEFPNDEDDVIQNVVAIKEDLSLSEALELTKQWAIKYLKTPRRRATLKFSWQTVDDSIEAFEFPTQKLTNEEFERERGDNSLLYQAIVKNQAQILLDDRGEAGLRGGVINVEFQSPYVENMWGQGYLGLDMDSYIKDIYNKYAELRKIWRKKLKEEYKKKQPEREEDFYRFSSLKFSDLADYPWDEIKKNLEHHIKWMIENNREKFPMTETFVTDEMIAQWAYKTFFDEYNIPGLWKGDPEFIDEVKKIIDEEFGYKLYSAPYIDWLHWTQKAWDDVNYFIKNQRDIISPDMNVSDAELARDWVKLWQEEKQVPLDIQRAPWYETLFLKHIQKMMQDKGLGDILGADYQVPPSPEERTEQLLKFDPGENDDEGDELISPEGESVKREDAWEGTGFKPPTEEEQESQEAPGMSEDELLDALSEAISKGDIEKADLLKEELDKLQNESSLKFSWQFDGSAIAKELYESGEWLKYLSDRAIAMKSRRYVVGEPVYIVEGGAIPVDSNIYYFVGSFRYSYSGAYMIVDGNGKVRKATNIRKVSEVKPKLIEKLKRKELQNKSSLKFAWQIHPEFLKTKIQVNGIKHRILKLVNKQPGGIARYKDIQPIFGQRFQYFMQLQHGGYLNWLKTGIYQITDKGEAALKHLDKVSSLVFNIDKKGLKFYGEENDPNSWSEGQEEKEETQNSQTPSEEARQSPSQVDIKYPSVEDIIEAHDEVIVSYGGLPGLTPEGANRIEAAIGRMQSGFGEEQFYPSILEKAAVLCHSMITSHPFADANKRTGFLAAIYFLHDNGFSVGESEALADIIISVASDAAGYEHLLEWIQTNTAEVTQTHGEALKKLTWSKDVPKPPATYKYSFTTFEHVAQHLNFEEDENYSVSDYDDEAGELRIFNEVRRILQKNNLLYVNVNSVVFDEFDSANVYHAVAYFSVVLDARDIESLIKAIRVLDPEMWLGVEDVSDEELSEEILERSIGTESSLKFGWQVQQEGVITLPPERVMQVGVMRVGLLAQCVNALDTATREALVTYLFENREDGISTLQDEVIYYDDEDMSEGTANKFFIIANYINKYNSDGNALRMLARAVKRNYESSGTQDWRLIVPSGESDVSPIEGSLAFGWQIQEETPVVDPNVVLQQLQYQIDEEVMNRQPGIVSQQYNYVYPITKEEYEYVRDVVMDGNMSPDTYKFYYIAEREIMGGIVYDLIGADSDAVIDTVEPSLSIDNLSDIPGLSRYSSLAFEKIQNGAKYNIIENSRLQL